MSAGKQPLGLWRSLRRWLALPARRLRWIRWLRRGGAPPPSEIPAPGADTAESAAVPTAAPAASVSARGWRASLPPLTLIRQARRLRPPAGLRLPGDLRLWVTALTLSFVSMSLVSHGRALLQLRLDPQGWLWLVLGLGVSLLSLVVNGLAWGWVLRWLGLRPRWEPLVGLYLVTNLRKFLPGGFWHLASRVQVLRSGPPGSPLAGPVSTPLALLATLLDPLLAAIAALALLPFGGWQGGLALLGLLPLALLRPRWLNPLLRRLERKRASALGLGRELEREGMAASVPGWPWPPLLGELAFVLLRFGGFACCVLAFDLQLSSDWRTWLAGFCLAWTAGLVVPGAPGGLGVFETVLLLRLSHQIPEASLLAVALTYRLVVTLGDLLAAALADLDGRLARRWPAAASRRARPAPPA
jgi:uncharacterized membrane protein YbhN (UPF0104 family)